MGVLDKFLDAIKLNDDYDDDEEFLDEDFADDFEEEKPRKKFFGRFKRNDEEDDFLEEEPSPAQRRTAVASAAATKTARQPAASSKITPMRTSRKGKSQNMEVCVIKPKSMEDGERIADTLMNGSTVVLNLEDVDGAEAQRIFDFTSGACYSLDGSLQHISKRIFILTPYNVEISGDFQDILNGTASIRNAN